MSSRKYIGLRFNLINHGRFGDMFKAEKDQYYLHGDQKMEPYYAIRSWNIPSEADKDMVVLEANLLTELRHPNIVSCIESYWKADEFHTVMEFCYGGNLQTKIANKVKGSFPENVIRFWLIQLCRAVQFFHQHGLIHCNIRPSNILFTEAGAIKLGLPIVSEIFQLSAVVKGEDTYLAPELVYHKGFKYSKKIDIWSLGCVLHELITLQPVSSVVYNARTEGYISFKLAPQMSEALIRIVRRMLIKVSPEQRPSVDEVLEAMTGNN